MAATSTEQLSCMLSSLVACEGVSALGVFPADQVPTIDRSTHCCFILNTDARGNPGEHWLAFFYNRYDGTLEYFDSYGMSLLTYHAVYATLHSRGLVALCTPANSVGPLQSDMSFVCGHYCIAFLYWRTKKIHTKATHFCISLARAYSAAAERDKYVVKFVRELLHRGNCCTDMLARTHCSQSCVCIAKQGKAI
jgi:hypothetical protein